MEVKKAAQKMLKYLEVLKKLCKNDRKNQPKHAFIRTQIFIMKITVRNYIYSETILKFLHNG